MRTKPDSTKASNLYTVHHCVSKVPYCSRALCWKWVPRGAQYQGKLGWWSNTVIETDKDCTRAHQDTFAWPVLACHHLLGGNKKV